MSNSGLEHIPDDALPQSRSNSNQVTVEKWNDNVLFFRSPFMPGENWQVNGAILLGEGSNVVWDTLSRPTDLAQIRPFLGPGGTLAVYSHADWDHCWGTGAIPFSNVIAHEKALARFENELPETLQAMNRKYHHFWADVTLRSPDLTFAKSICLEMGSFTLRFNHFGGHTADSIIGVIPEFGLVLGGDSVEKIPVINDPADVPQWVGYLEDLCKQPDVRYVLPGHGNLAGTDLILQNLEYLKALLSGADPGYGEADPFYQETHLNNCRIMGVPYGNQ